MGSFELGEPLAVRPAAADRLAGYHSLVSQLDADNKPGFTCGAIVRMSVDDDEN